MTDIQVVTLDSWYGGNAITARCRVRAVGPLGEVFYDLPVALSPALLATGAPPATVAAAVATALNVDAATVTVAGQDGA